ncbi:MULTISPECIES: phage tail assembly protein [unclassified Wolbachia]|uniref:phage tail assembly protein n=1 Tax=unclassified Wolbachia TaxID=2640676 RepID=UPI001BC08BA1|nr:MULTISPECIES: phage tail assembly protein [unclassified Wolbachia]MBR9983024.1 phage tail assembly protein [Wolbachia endosymbiont of Homalodisca vitripennis]MCJ7454179.1 phage tail assembly protein [Wolbachia endosymbiont of Homalodisca vitripennis]MCJ7476099.1 phage tail assembly protein [Wolbachia endosymbiont of Homalodisca vitripennis]
MQKIKLTEPIKIDGTLVSELTLRRPKVRDRLAVERMGNSDAEKEVALIANLASISREAVEELDLADYSKIQEVLQGFLSQQKN